MQLHCVSVANTLLMKIKSLIQTSTSTYRKKGLSSLICYMSLVWIEFQWQTTHDPENCQYENANATTLCECCKSIINENKKSDSNINFHIYDIEKKG